ncbi:MAG: pilus assembly protein TadG-related protein [Chakrabartia sp.]
MPLPFLTRLFRNRAGNVILIATFSLVPLMLILGGGIDMARVYLAKDQLQGACDAAVLTTRKIVQGHSLSVAAKDAGQSFFKLNYPSGSFGTSHESLALSVATDGTVKGVAKARVGQSAFNIAQLIPTEISVNCAANLEMGNTDVVFALDVTGSMNERNPGDSQTRMEALRSSVRNFTAMLNGQVNPDTQVRFGFVPFSSTVNVGFLLQPEWIVDRWTYQSRVADGTTQTGSTQWVPVSGRVVESSYNAPSYWEAGSEINGPGTWNCVSVPNPTTSVNASSGPWSPVPGSNGQLEQRVNTQIINGQYFDGEVVGRQCVIYVYTYINYKLTSTETRAVGGGSGPPPGLYNWIYKPVEFDVSGVKTSARSFVVPKFSDQQTSVTIHWTGCIEERDTVRATNFSPIPAAAYDLDIDRIPNSDATRWRPFLPGLVYWRRDRTDWSIAPWSTTLNATRPEEYAGGLAAACPAKSRKLATMTQQGVTDYVNALYAGGTTYLDIGMIWAARLASPTGLFASQNQSAPNGRPISRNIIFMTDGAIETHDYIYEAYGVSGLDRRRTDAGVAPTDSETDALVDARFRAACEAAKAKGISVWTIAFGTALTPTLKACASNSQYFMAANSAELNATFSAIAANIARLRLTR